MAITGRSLRSFYINSQDNCIKKRIYMTTDTEKIDEIVREIKEKIKKNPKYLHPMNNDLQEDAKIFGFPSTGRYIVWLQQNGILKNPTNIHNKDSKDTAQRMGFNSYRDYHRQIYQNNKEYKREQIKERRYIRGVQTPMEINKACAASLGVDIGEMGIAKKILEIIFEYVEKMGYRNHGFDFTCKNPRQEFIDKYPQFKLKRDSEYKIDAKTRCLSHDNKNWSFDIDSNIPDYFLFSALDNRKDLNILHCLLIHKDETIRGNKLCERDYLTLTNKPKFLLPFKRFDLIDKIDIKGIYKELKDAQGS